MISLLLPTALHQNLPSSLRRITNLIRVLLVWDSQMEPPGASSNSRCELIEAAPPEARHRVGLSDG